MTKQIIELIDKLAETNGLISMVHDTNNINTIRIATLYWSNYNDESGFLEDVSVFNEIELREVIADLERLINMKPKQ